MNVIQKTEEKVFSYIAEHHMIEPQDRIVAGISGGADSVCLLFILLEWAKKMPLLLSVVHVNHGIRPEAEQDEHYVEKLCETQGIMFYPYHIDVRQKAKMEGCSEEEAGRLARYQAFMQTAEKVGANKIAVAHNSNDRGETMLFHLFRGSGIRGLSGIRPVRDQIIRPILCLERREVEAYLNSREIGYCRDATNDGDDYTRNRIRHHILSYAQQEISAGCVAHMAQTADMLAETEDYLELQTAEAMKDCILPECEKAGTDINRYHVQSKEMANLLHECSSYTIDIEAFLRQHKVIQKRILHALAVSLSPGGKDITYMHIRDLQTLFTEKGNRKVCLPFGIVGRRQYEVVILEREICGPASHEEIHNAQTAPEASQDLILQMGRIKISTNLAIANDGISDSMFKKDMNDAPTDTGICRILLDNGEEFELRVLSNEGIYTDFPQNRYTKWFDYDKIKQSLVLRTRQMGDYLTIAGKDGQMVHKSVKDYMITGKIPRGDRDRIPVLAEGQHVIWLVGYRISEYYKVDKNTKHILQVQLNTNKIFSGKSCNGSQTEDKNGGTC